MGGLAAAQKYWRERRGTLITEVRVGGPGSPWPTSAPRRIDAVRFEAPSIGIGIYSAAQLPLDALITALDGTDAEVIEAKQELQRDVIGQALVAVDLLELAYHAAKVTPVVVCRDTDALLAHVCERRGIHLTIVPVTIEDDY